MILDLLNERDALKRENAELKSRLSSSNGNAGGSESPPKHQAPSLPQRRDIGESLGGGGGGSSIHPDGGGSSAITAGALSPRGTRIGGDTTTTTSLAAQANDATSSAPPKGDDDGDEEEEEFNVGDLKARTLVLKEIIESERSYVRDLNTLNLVYYDPLATLIPKKDLTDIFQNLKMIISINNEMLQKMEERFAQANGNDSFDEVPDWQVGDIFMNLADYLKMYTSYCTNQANAVETVCRLRAQDAVFAQFLSENEFTDTSAGLSLDSFLIKPVQRVCKYPLLLREVVKETASDHPDRGEVVKAYGKLAEVVDHLNEMKRSSERRIRMVEISQKITGLGEFKLVSPSRYFIRDGKMDKVSHGKRQPRHFFLFNDVLLYAKANNLKKTYQYKDMVLLDRLLVRPLSNTDKLQYAFELCRLDAKKRKYICICSSDAEREEWIADIQKCIDYFLEQVNKPTTRRRGTTLRLSENVPKPRSTTQVPKWLKGSGT